jgi:hypothetical protein
MNDLKTRKVVTAFKRMGAKRRKRKGGPNKHEVWTFPCGTSGAIPKGKDIKYPTLRNILRRLGMSINNFNMYL